jgi:CubicO group peptidase (beta-lactamase class C family)
MAEPASTRPSIDPALKDLLDAFPLQIRVAGGVEAARQKMRQIEPPADLLPTMRIVERTIGFGHFDAVSLGAMYAMLGGGGQLGGVRILSEETVRKASEIQNDQQDRVIMMTMQWWLGYHRLPLVHKQLPRAYGHFGFAGSGAFADPEHDLSLAMVCNRGQGTPIGDMRILSSVRPQPALSCPSISKRRR